MTQCSVISPIDGQLVGTLEYSAYSNVVAVCEKLNGYFSRQAIPLQQRMDAIGRIAQIIEQHTEQLACTMTREMGKPIRQARNECQKCITACRYLQRVGDSWMQPERITINEQCARIYRCPIGVVLLITPWNYPLWQVIRQLIVQILLGNRCLVKPSPKAPGCAIMLDSLLAEHQDTANLMQAMLIDHHDVEALIASGLIHGLSFTGSEPVGRQLAAMAGRALLPTVMELGGSDPMIVCADADLDLAAQALVTARLSNCGQVCIAPKRAIVHAGCYEHFIAQVNHRVDQLTAGDPRLEGCDLGPLVDTDARRHVHQMVQASINAGASCHRGAYIPDGVGAYYPATVLTDVTTSHPVFQQECFGPVIALSVASSDEACLSLAQQSSYGLGASLFSNNLAWAQEVAIHQLSAGICAINALPHSHIGLPFGGIGASGFGRECGRSGLDALANIKTIYEAPAERLAR